MKVKRILMSIVFVLVASAMVFSMVAAEDGDLFRRNISKTPELETEKAAIFMMDFYVPAQASTGELTPVVYTLADGTISTVDYPERDYAKPLVSVWIDGIADTIYHEESVVSMTDGGIVFGAFDGFVGVSLDDGTTWKTTNLSRSADLSSIQLDSGRDYPGHVHNIVHQVFDDNIMVAWVSKYCEGGTPLYSLTTDNQAVDYTDYLTDLEETYGKDAVYLYDLFGVAGDQKSVDYADQGYPEVGEIPYSCVWTARGKLLAGDDPSTTVAETTYVMWAKPERLTSGVRDANLPAVDCAAGAGCMLTWQEDPEGLRPGQGLGPGEGWSGAVAWQQTDIWYSHISQADFDIVFADDTLATDAEVPMAEFVGETMPKSYVPMAMPVRLTDNAMCKTGGNSETGTASPPYCFIDFDNIDDIDPLALPTAPTTDSDFCETQEEWDTPGGSSLNICVTEDGRLLNGRVASTRVRMNLKPYTPADAVDSDGDGIDEKSAWIVMAAEESKALGDTAVECLPGDDTCVPTDPVDIGKDVWYYSFDPFQDHFMVNQGGMLNQPAQCKFDASVDDPLCTGLEEGDFYPVQTDSRGYEFYLTEIARRFALTTNSVSAAVNSESGLSAMLIYKQGIINQGGPADIMLRRVLIDDTDFDQTVDNPYAFENMECDEWVYTDGLNPNYLQGVCLSPAINITGTTIVTCDLGTGNDACADTFPVNNDGSNTTGGEFPKVYEWRNCDGVASVDSCEDDNDLDDQTWENPFDVSKGHRGFLDGDYVMMMYAWSPNWNSNAVGNDHYNLYTRRSFDGGVTWTTTPGDLGGLGTSWTENYYGATIGEYVPFEWTFGAGDFEQARNVSQLNGNQVTILDPRYSPTGGLKLYPTIRTDWLTANGFSFEGLPYEDDAIRDPSKFFMVYETGDNTTVAEGEATPLDLFYSRATVYGDVYEVMDYFTTKDDEVLDRWPWLENKSEILSGEAGMLANPGGTFMYAVWNQWEEDIQHFVDEYGQIFEIEQVFNSDILFRRMLYLPDDTEAMIAPYATLLYVNDTMLGWETDDQILLVATAKVFGIENGLVEFEWIYTSPDGTVYPLGGYEKILSTSVQNLPGWAQNPGQPGWAQFSFRAKDKNDNWSNTVDVKVYIAETTYDIFTPLILK